MPDITELLARARPREWPVAVCLAGDLAGEADRLQEELQRIGDGWEPSSLADTDPRAEIVRQIEALREQMKQHTVTFRLRSIGHIPYSRLVAAHPPAEDAPDGTLWDDATFLPALLAASCAEPAMTAEQAVELLAVLNDGQAQELFRAALAVNAEATPLPF